MLDLRDVTIHSNDFEWSYHQLLHAALNGPTERNARTGVKIRGIRGGASFKVDLSDGIVPEPCNRRTFPHIAAAELAWQLLGTRDASFVMKYAPKLWGKFIEPGPSEHDPAEPCPYVETAYGYRWRKSFGRDQLDLAIKALIANPTNRQVWVQAWDPRRDGLGGPQPKNIPCPIGFTLSVQDDRLHSSMFLRSSDLYVGLPYDVMGYALLVDAVATSLGRKPGSLHVTCAHAHIYEPHWAMAEEDLGRPYTEDPEAVKLPRFAVEEIFGNPDAYVADVKTTAKARKQHPIVRLPELIE